MGPGAGVLQSEYPLSTVSIGFGGARTPQKRMQKAWDLSFEVPWIAAAEDAICGRFSSVPWHLEDETDTEIDDQSSSEDARSAKALLEFPSRGLKVGAPYYRSDLWSLTARAMGVCGSAFVLLDQPEMLANTPAAMVPIAPWRLWDQNDAQGNLIGWWIDRTNTEPGIPVRLDEILHYQLRRRFDGHFGIGLIESAFLKPEISNALDRHLSLLLSAGGRLSGILSPKDGVIEPDTMIQLERDWRTIVEQADAAKRLQLVRAPINFQRTTLSPQELQIRDLMDGARDDLLALWGVPFTTIGGSAPTGLNSGDSRKFDEAQIWRGPVHSRLTIFREVTQYQLLDRWAGLGAPIELEIDEPSFEEDAPKFDLLDKSQNLVMRNRERRALIGLEPLGIPELDDAILLPMTLTAYAEAPTEDEATRRLAAPVVTSLPTPQLLAAGETGEKASLRTSLVRLRTTLQAKVTPRLKSSVQEALDEQKRETIAKIRRASSQVMADPKKTSVWWSDDREAKRLRSALTGHLTGVADSVAHHIGESFGSKADPVERLLTKGVSRVKSINDTTRDAISDVLAKAIADGATIDEAIAAVEGATTFDEARAEVIARTELMFAYNSAAIGSYEEAGVTMLQAIDGDQDEECAARDGQEFPVDEAYQIEDHPNGTLDWVPVL